MRVFADTSFYLALASSKDKWHEVALDFAAHHSGNIITTEYVLFELGALMSGLKLRAYFFALVQSLRDDPQTMVVPASSRLFEQSLSLFGRRLDKTWSLTDCSLFTVMEHFGIEASLTSDHHFEQAGFISLLYLP